MVILKFQSRSFKMVFSAVRLLLTVMGMSLSALLPAIRRPVNSKTLSIAIGIASVITTQGLNKRKTKLPKKLNCFLKLCRCYCLNLPCRRERLLGRTLKLHLPPLTGYCRNF